MKKVINAGKILFYILIATVFIYWILAIFYLPNEREEDRSIFEFYTEGWCYVDQDGNRIPVEIPSKVDVQRGECYVVENVLPDNVEDDICVIFRTARQDMKVYVDGQLRTVFSTEDTRLFGKYSPTYYVMCYVNHEDAGKTITAEYKADNKNSGSIGDIFYANNTGFTQYEMKLQGGIFVIGIIMFIVSTITLITGGVIYAIYRKPSSLTSISFAIFGVAIWIMTNSVFRQYFAKNISAISDVSFVILPLIVAPFAIYVNRVMKNRYMPAYAAVAGLSVMVAVVTTILHVLKIADYMESFAATGLVFVLLLVVAVVTSIIDIVRGHFKEYAVTAAALMIAGGCMLIQMIIYLRGGKAYDVSVAAVGLLVMLILATISAIKDIYGTYQERDRAKYENAAKTQFLTNMSHEIRTPINAILGMNTMILRKSKDEEVLGYANNITSASNTLLTIVNDILDFSKIESGKMELVNVQYNFMDVINDIYNMIDTKAKEKNLEFRLDIASDIPRGMFGDDVRIKQILINLLTNAVKYTPEGTVTLKVSRNADLSGKKVSLHFDVTDTGIGIKDEDIGKLTELFVRIEESRNRNIEGTGLGINIVGSLLNMMDSKLEVASVYGEGSSFYFDLVQDVTNAEVLGGFAGVISNSTPKAEEHETSLRLPDARLLVVDDNEMNRVVFTCLTSELECKVDAAESGKECLDLVKKNKYDIIFMDHMMPEMDGIETLQHMKEYGDYINAKTPVIILTANAINGAEEEYLGAGFDAYLSKPIDPDKLVEMIGKYAGK